MLRSKDYKGFKDIPVGDLSPGCKQDLLLVFKVPNKLKNEYSFQLYEGEHYFGNSSVLKTSRPTEEYKERFNNTKKIHKIDKNDDIKSKTISAETILSKISPI